MSELDDAQSAKVFLTQILAPVAIHEAGHAVVAECLGWPIAGSVQLELREDVLRGTVEIGDAPSERVYLAQIVAGQVAEKIAGHRKRISWKSMGGPKPLLESVDRRRFRPWSIKGRSRSGHR
jgi:hypothetical protein